MKIQLGLRLVSLYATVFWPVHSISTNIQKAQNSRRERESVVARVTFAHHHSAIHKRV